MNLSNIKQNIFSVLEGENKSSVGLTFQALLSILIFANVIICIVYSEQTFKPNMQRYFLIFDYISCVIFTIEYILRITTCPSNKLKYALKPLNILDIIVLVPFYLPMIIPVDLRILRIFRILRLARILKTTRYTNAHQIIIDTIKSKKEQLTMVFITALAVFIVFSIMIFYAENNAQPDVFKNIPSAMWYAIATITTIGYGDIYPITNLGKLCTSVFSLLSISIFAIPTGILSAGFAEQAQKEKREKTIADLTISEFKELIKSLDKK